MAVYDPSLQDFDWGYFSTNTLYPKENSNIQLGGGWTYSIEPISPPQRDFRLFFNTLRWFYNPDGTLDLVTEPEWNAGRLDAFYQAHRGHLPFNFEHPDYGWLQVTFKNPLAWPEKNAAGGGTVNAVELLLTEFMQ